MKKLSTSLNSCVATLFVVAAALIPTVGLVANAAPGGANPYPYPRSTYWAWQNRPDLPATLGEPAAWNDNAQSQGWPVGPYPRQGDIAVFEANVYGAPPTGHVAVVEQVLDDGSFVTSQMDDTDCLYDSSTCGRVRTRSYPIMKGMSFIHTMKDTRTTWGFASGASGWTARGLSDGYMGGPGWYYPLNAASDDPQLVSPALDIDLTSYSAVEVAIAIGIPVSDPTVQVYFATQAQPDFSEARSVTIKANADGQLATLTADFAANPEWQGNLTRLRVDPTGPGKSGGVRVDRIRLVPRPSGDDNFTAFAYTLATRGGRPQR